MFKERKERLLQRRNPLVSATRNSHDAISLIGYTKINDYRKLGLENAIYMRCCIETLKEKVWEMARAVACKHNAKKVLKEGQDEWLI